MTAPKTSASLLTPHVFYPMTNPVAMDRDGAAVATSAKGCRMVIGGKTYYDMLSGLGCVNIGYGNTAVCDAAYEAMKTLSYAHTFAGQANVYNAALSDKLVELTKGDFTKFFFASTGSDANESAIKIALRYWRLRGQFDKRLFLSREHAYHGNTVVATSLTGIDHYHPQFGLPMPEVVRHVKTAYPYRDGITPAEAAERAIRSLEDTIASIGAHKIAAMFAEPIQSTGSMLIPPEGYLQSLQAVCAKNDILFICDEVVTGFGKTGSMFAYQHYGIRPDMVTMAKGLTSAYFPISAVGLGKKVLAALGSADEAFEHGFTHCGHPVGSATALANIAVIENERLVEHVNEVIAPTMARRLAALAESPIVGEIRHQGVLAGIEFNVGDTVHDREAFCERVGEAVYARGVIARPLGTALGFCVPMVATAEELDEVFDRVAEAMDAVHAGSNTAVAA